MTTVVLQFGDGSFHTIEMSEEDPDEAITAARDWVNDNAWLEVQDDNGNVVASGNL